MGATSYSYPAHFFYDKNENNMPGIWTDECERVLVRTEVKATNGPLSKKSWKSVKLRPDAAALNKIVCTVVGSLIGKDDPDADVDVRMDDVDSTL